MRVVFVHGACAVDADWWWAPMVAPLAEQGLSSAAVELPSCGRTPDGLGDLHADADAVRAALTGEPTLLCAHSYGGMVATDAAAGRDDVAGIVYVSSVLPAEGESLAGLAEPGTRPWLAPVADDAVGLRADLTPDDVRFHFLGDADGVTVHGARARLGCQSAAAFTQAPRGIGWRTVPSTYVVCTRDRATRPERQRHLARRADRVVELAVDHHPFLSRPARLAAALAEAAPGG